MAIGDGQNDIEMIRYAGLGIAWKGFPKVRETADALANHNFKSILYFQGYNDEDIILIFNFKSNKNYVSLPVNK